MSQAAAYDLLRNLHLVFGSAALVLFWAQLARRKGGTSHKRLGWAYNCAMTGVLATALPMTIFFYLEGQTQTSLFLGFLSTITLSAMIEAVMASRNRTSDEWMSGPLMTAATVFIAAYSVLLVVMFFSTRFWLLLIMGAVGLHATWNHIQRLRLKPPYSWVSAHINGMLGTGIAVHIAFLSFGLRNLIGYDPNLQLLGFLAPLIGFQFIGMHYHRKFVRSASATSESS